MLLDNVGWHRTKKLKWWPRFQGDPGALEGSYRAPRLRTQLNAAESVWQYLRQTYLSNRLLQTYDAVVEAAAKAWNNLVAEVGRIASITTRSWAVRRQ